MAKKILFRILTLAVCTVMLFSSAVITSNAAEKATKQSFVSRLDFGYDDSDTVRAIVVFKGESGIDLKQKGVSDAKTASKAVAKKRSALIKSLESNYNASVIYSYSTLLNGVAVDVSYGNLKNIEQLDCIEKVYIANRYSAPIAEVSIKPAMVSAGQSVGFTAGTDGGKGTVIAVLDTGLSANHEAFSTMYMGDTVALTQNTVNALKAEKELMGGYLNKKIPYVYDYAENDTNVSSTE